MQAQRQTSLARSVVTHGLAGACAVVLSGCGQKGPLTLPPGPIAAATPAASAAAPASAPVAPR